MVGVRVSVFADNANIWQSQLRMPKFRYRLKFLDHVHHLPAGERILLGRGENCHVHLDGELISREHAILHVSSNRAMLNDLGSRNGTFVNGMPVDGSVQLKHGDRIKIAFFDLTFEAVPVTHTPIPTQELVYCSSCSSLLMGDMKFCVNCGATVARDMSRTMCPQCRASITPHMSFCGMCGCNLTPTGTDHT